MREREKKEVILLFEKTIISLFFNSSIKTRTKLWAKKSEYRTQYPHPTNYSNSVIDLILFYFFDINLILLIITLNNINNNNNSITI